MKEDLWQLACERLAEDEALRDNLTDEGFAPLLNWACSFAGTLAERIAITADPQSQMENVTAQLRQILQTAVQTASSRDGEALIQAIPKIAPFEPEASRMRLAIQSLKLQSNPDENAIQIATALEFGSNPSEASGQGTSTSPNLPRRPTIE